MNGLGFLIWNLADMPAEALDLVALLRSLGARWVSIKLADGEYYYNQAGGNDKKLKPYIECLQANGIEVGGWGYNYPNRPGPQGGRASERIQKLNLTHWLVDAEGEWKRIGYKKESELLMGSLDVNKKFLSGLCSYRFPHLHAPFPFKGFLLHEKCRVVAPQMYWMGSHNPREQILTSLAEYRNFYHPDYELFFCPIGSTFGATVGGKWWEPSVDDLKEFLSTCREQRFRAYGFYSLDWILRKNRTDWIEAIAGAPLPPPPPPPDYSGALIVDNCSWVNARLDPNPQVDNRLAVLRAGTAAQDLEQDSGNWRKVKVEIECWVHGDYLRPIEEG
jgi:hypothetical protein